MTRAERARGRADLRARIRFALGLQWAPWLDSAEMAIRQWEVFGGYFHGADFERIAP